MAKFIKCTHLQTGKPVYVTLDQVLTLDQPVEDGGALFNFASKETLAVNETPKQIFEQIPRS
jgi:hypothetical protein